MTRSVINLLLRSLLLWASASAEPEKGASESWPRLDLSSVGLSTEGAIRQPWRPKLTFDLKGSLPAGSTLEAVWFRGKEALSRATCVMHGSSNPQCDCTWPKAPGLTDGGVFTLEVTLIALDTNLVQVRHALATLTFRVSRLDWGEGKHTFSVDTTHHLG